jgi:hypothetical protein
LLECVSHRIAELIKSISGCAVLAIFIPRSGLFGEQRRSLHAIGHYDRNPPTAEELAAVESTEAVEEAVRKTVDNLARALTACVGNFLVARNATGRIVLDSRSAQEDEKLMKALTELLPKMPVNVPLIPHLDAVVSLPPHPNMERLGDRLKIEPTSDSHQTHGLQIADFIAGDVRTFFNEVPKLLTEATDDAPLVNERVLFPQVLRKSKLTCETLKNAQTPGKSALPLYRTCFAHGLISCYTSNGQLRTINLEDGSIFDLMD